MSRREALKTCDRHKIWSLATFIVIELAQSLSTYVSAAETNSGQNNGKKTSDAKFNVESYWLSLGAGFTTGKHSGPCIIASGTYELALEKHEFIGITRLLWSQDLGKDSQNTQDFTFREIGQLFGLRHQFKNEKILWALGPSWVVADDKINNDLNLETL